MEANRQQGVAENDTEGDVTTQLNFLAERDAAMASVAENAEEATPNFAAEAAACILDYLSRHGPTPGETLTDACKAAGIKPHDDRAFGPVYMRLSRRGAIVKAGAAVRRKGHGTSGGTVWAIANG